MDRLLLFFDKNIISLTKICFARSKIRGRQVNSWIRFSATDFKVSCMLCVGKQSTKSNTVGVSIASLLVHSSLTIHSIPFLYCHENKPQCQMLPWIFLYQCLSLYYCAAFFLAPLILFPNTSADPNPEQPATALAWLCVLFSRTLLHSFFYTRMKMTFADSALAVTRSFSIIFFSVLIIQTIVVGTVVSLFDGTWQLKAMTALFGMFWIKNEQCFGQTCSLTQTNFSR